MPSSLSSLSTARLRGLRRRLGSAEDDHNIIRRALNHGVDSARLADDLDRWSIVGGSIADVAALIAEHARASAFCNARPTPSLLTARLSEAFDDLLDEAAWEVVDAAARLADAERAARTSI